MVIGIDENLSVCVMLTLCACNMRELFKLVSVINDSLVENTLVLVVVAVTTPHGVECG